MRLQLKKDGLTGDALKFAEALETALPDFPEAMSKADIANEIKTHLKGLLGDDGNLNVKFLDDVNTLKGELDIDKEGSLKNIMKKQGDKINDLISKVNSNTVVNHFDQFIDELKKAEPELKAIQMNQSGQKSFVIKAAAVTTTSSSIDDNGSAGAAQRLGDGPVYTIQRGTPFVLQFVSVGNTTASALVWFDETQAEGDFAITAEGAIKPLKQYLFARNTATYQKAAGRTTITDEFINDYPRIVSTIKQLMAIDCRNAMNAAVLADMVSNAGSYAYNGLDDAIDNPDDFAAIGAAIAQLQSLYHTPNVLVLNPADAWRLRLTKGSDGHYVMAPFTWNGQTYEFGQVIIDPGVTAGNFFIGDGTAYHVDLKGDIIVRIGYAATTLDFEKNQQTIIVEQYYYNYISTARKPAFIYASFATIKADIAA